MYLRIQDALNVLETGFNIAGCIPFVSLFSGCLRALAGKVEMIAGIALATIGFIAFAITADLKWQNIAVLGSELALHGTLNIIRGFGEAILCASTIAGNLFLLIPNMTKDSKFSPYFEYGMLTGKTFLSGALYQTEPRMR